MEHQAEINAHQPDVQDQASCCAKANSSAPESIYQFRELQQRIGNRSFGRLVQAKLNISEPGDEHEQEADQVANQIMRMPATPGAAVAPGANPLLPLQSRVSSGRGQPLPESMCAFFGPRFGYDFSNVHVHTDVQAKESAQQLGARAYTVGRDIVFGAGQYSPDTSAGKRLLAHELAHVAQNQSDDAIDSDRIRRQPTSDPTRGPGLDPVSPAAEPPIYPSPGPR